MIKMLLVIDAEIARQSTTREEVQRAIELLREPSKGMDYYWLDAQMHDALNLAITALQEYQPTSSKTEKDEPCWYCIGIESHGIATIKTVTDEYGCELGAYDTPYNFCPNCGRKIKEDRAKLRKRSSQNE